MPNVPRVFKETQDQIIIQQGRGLQIVNNAATQRIIEAENYYKLFNGYKEPFLDSTKSDAKCTCHVCFTTACCTGNKKIPMFRYIFAGSKSANQFLV